MEVKQRAPEELKPFDRNPKQHPEEQIEKLVESIEEFGWTNPILTVEEDGDNLVVAGHARLKAAKKLGLRKVPTIDLEMPYEKAVAYNLADNKLAEMAEWEDELLAEQIQDIDDSDVEVELTGFDDDEISALLDEQKEAEEDDFEEPDEVNPRCEKGQVWKLGDHWLMCGDATSEEDVEKLMDGSKADMVFTDPPYGMGYSGGRTQIVAKDEKRKVIDGDVDSNIEEFVESALNVANGKHCYICINSINLSDAVSSIPQNEGIIVWKKQRPGLGYGWIRRYCEFIIFTTDKEANKEDESEFDFWEINTDDAKDYFHGTQKPIALSSRAIKFSSNIGDIVVDLFGGSGSTLIACEQLDRRCYMMEIDPKYCEVIMQRWEELTGREAELIEDA